VLPETPGWISEKDKERESRKWKKRIKKEQRERGNQDEKMEKMMRWGGRKSREGRGC